MCNFPGYPISFGYMDSMYRKSHERECISWYMGTSDVFKILKIAIWEL